MEVRINIKLFPYIGLIFVGKGCANLNRYIEVIAIYHFIDKSRLKNRMYSIDEEMTPLRDWCETNGQYTYNVYLDIETRDELKVMLQDAQMKKFTKVIVINEGVLGNLENDIRYKIIELDSYGVTVEAINRNK